VDRPSLIHGGPDYLDSTTSDDSVARGDSFTIPVPRLAAADPPYVVTITPSDTKTISDGGPTPADLAPPMPLKVPPSLATVGPVITLAAGPLRRVAGRIVDATGYGVPGIRVAAEGRLAKNRPLERVSTVSVTDATGAYSLYISNDAFPVVDIVRHPTDMPGLTLRLHDVP